MEEMDFPMKIVTITAEGTSEETIDLGSDFKEKWEKDQKEIEAMEASGELAGWCKCNNGESRSVLDTVVVSFDYRRGDDGHPDVPQNLGASHGCYCTVCNGLVQSG